MHQVLPTHSSMAQRCVYSEKRYGTVAHLSRRSLGTAHFGALASPCLLASRAASCSSHTPKVYDAFPFPHVVNVHMLFG